MMNYLEKIDSELVAAEFQPFEEWQEMQENGGNIVGSNCIVVSNNLISYDRFNDSLSRGR